MHIYYPDVLGYITAGTRLQAGVIQCALATRPRIPRAGRPFEALLLLQNCSDVTVAVKASLIVPELDAKKQKGRFLCQNPQATASLQAGEVGFLSFPVMTMPDTAMGDSYKLACTVEAKAAGAGNKIRPNEGGTPISLEDMPQSVQAVVEGLRKLTFGAARRGLFGVTVEATFGLMSAAAGSSPPNASASYTRLWTLRDHPDDAALLERHRRTLIAMLPLLKREKLAAALAATTAARFSEGGYELHAAELRYVVKLLVCVIELASPREDAFDYLGGEHLNISPALRQTPTHGTLKLPSWCKAFLRLLEDDPQAATQPVEVLAGVLYDELLRDAVIQGCRMIPKLTGDSLGSEDDIRAYAEGLVAALAFQARPLTLHDAYLPLVMAGLAWFDHAVLREERLADDLMAMVRIVPDRQAESDDDAALVLRMTEQVLQRALHSYGLNP